MSDVFVVIREISSGNDRVGDMWKETKIFPADATIQDVMNWADKDNIEIYGYSSRDIIITKPEGGINEDKRIRGKNC